MNPGDRVRVDRDDRTYEGVLLPSSSDDHLVVKLEGGYNVGVDRADADVDVLAEDVYEIDGKDSVGDEAASEIDFDDDLPTISLISTGGTIASTVDYRTGAVTAQFDAEDVLRAVPDASRRESAGETDEHEPGASEQEQSGDGRRQQPDRPDGFRR